MAEDGWTGLVLNDFVFNLFVIFLEICLVNQTANFLIRSRFLIHKVVRF